MNDLALAEGHLNKLGGKGSVTNRKQANANKTNLMIARWSGDGDDAAIMLKES